LFLWRISLTHPTHQLNHFSNTQRAQINTHFTLTVHGDIVIDLTQGLNDSQLFDGKVLVDPKDQLGERIDDLHFAGLIVCIGLVHSLSMAQQLAIF
jgi:hypothetical protein